LNYQNNKTGTQQPNTHCVKKAKSNTACKVVGLCFPFVSVHQIAIFLIAKYSFCVD